MWAGYSESFQESYLEKKKRNKENDGGTKEEKEIERKGRRERGRKLIVLYLKLSVSIIV